MTPPQIQALGIVQDGSPTRWKARWHVEGIGWLEAWGRSLIEAMEALQAMAAQRVAMVDRGSDGGRHPLPRSTHEPATAPDTEPRPPH
jgi:hypothetical protein